MLWMLSMMKDLASISVSISKWRMLPDLRNLKAPFKHLNLLPRIRYRSKYLLYRQYLGTLFHKHLINYHSRIRFLESLLRNPSEHHNSSNLLSIPVRYSRLDRHKLDHYKPIQLLWRIALRGRGRDALARRSSYNH